MAAGGALATLLVLGACSAGSSGDTRDTASSAGAATAADAGAAAVPEGGERTSPVVDLATARAPERAQEVISTADLRLDAKDPEAATSRATEIARDAGGYLFSQNATLSDDASVEAVYKVPPEQFDTTLDAFAKLGDVASRTVDTEDVTGTVVDLEARLVSARTSVERLRELMNSSGGVDDLLAVEQSLSEREAEMESLAAQLGALRARVDLATITVHVSETKPAGRAEVSDGIPGFFSGFDTGAAAFGNTLLVIVTAFGFALPFVVVFVVVLAPLWYFTRRRRVATQP